MFLKVNFIYPKKSQTKAKQLPNALFLVFTYSFYRSYKNNSTSTFYHLRNLHKFYIYYTILEFVALELEEMCPLRFILIFFSAVLAAYLAWTTMSSTTPEIDFTSGNHKDKSSSDKDNFSLIKVI